MSGAGPPYLTYKWTAACITSTLRLADGVLSGNKQNHGVCGGVRCAVNVQLHPSVAPERQKPSPEGNKQL